MNDAALHAVRRTISGFISRPQNAGDRREKLGTAHIAERGVQSPEARRFPKAGLAQVAERGAQSLMVS
tara:strand:- start:2224 stop:2427 length:204 start_codon:yes stop_codon:yes gene_type:complete